MQIAEISINIDGNLITGIFGAISGLAGGYWIWHLNRRGTRIDRFADYASNFIQELYLCLEDRHQFFRSEQLLNTTLQGEEETAQREKFLASLRDRTIKDDIARKRVAALKYNLSRVQFHCNKTSLSEYADNISQIIQLHPYQPTELYEWVTDNMAPFAVKGASIHPNGTMNLEEYSGLRFYASLGLIKELTNRLIKYAEENEPLNDKPE